MDAADGRTLGLFSSRRAAEAAAEALRERLPHLTILAQGEAQLPELSRLFVEDPHACLFGTLSLWQGLDVPGDTCQLVLIDRIPFPRPDDPLMSARQQAADQAGGNGFMQVAATHAALLLAQGAGRLIRTTSDKGVVAILDPRLVTARYGGFLRASLPPMWSHHGPRTVAASEALRAAGLPGRPGDVTSTAAGRSAGRPARCRTLAGRMCGMGSTYVVSDVHGHLATCARSSRRPGSSTATTAGPGGTPTSGCSATWSTADPTASAWSGSCGRSRSRRPTRCAC